MGTGGIGRGIGNVRWRGWSRWCRGWHNCGRRSEAGSRGHSQDEVEQFVRGKGSVRLAVEVKWTGSAQVTVGVAMWGTLGHDKLGSKFWFVIPSG